MQSRAGLSSILHYCQKEKKTRHDNRQLVTGINCLPASAYKEFVSTKLFYRKDSARMFYHLLQSFSPDEALTPETAHEIAVKFASEQFKGYEVLVATHVDKDHIHSHFIINCNYSVLLRNPQFLHKVEKWKRAEKNQRNVNIQEAKKVVC